MEAYAPDASSRAYWYQSLGLLNIAHEDAQSGDSNVHLERWILRRALEFMHRLSKERLHHMHLLPDHAIFGNPRFLEDQRVAAVYQRCLYTRNLSGNRLRENRLPLAMAMAIDLIRVADDVHSALQCVVSALEVMGTDLEAFGAQELALWRGGMTTGYPRSCKRSDGRIRLVTLEYGPQVSDWHVYAVRCDCFDLHFAAEFWDMVDHPERAMPGAWDERADEWTQELWVYKSYEHWYYEPPDAYW